MNNKEYKTVIDEASEIFKALAHPTRFCIVSRLMTGSLNVSQMQACIDIAQPNVSQHLTILKSKGIIEGRRNGSEIVYSLVDEHVKKIVEVYFNIKEIPRT
jgi:DNA-binding transcriptional ArsR family regulator